MTFAVFGLGLGGFSTADGIGPGSRWDTLRCGKLLDEFIHFVKCLVDFFVQRLVDLVCVVLLVCSLMAVWRIPGIVASSLHRRDDITYLRCAL